MGPRRTCTGMEFLGPEGVRFLMDGDGWRLVTPRNLGEAALQRGRGLLAKLEECRPPEDPRRLEPFSLEEIGLHAAKAFNLRVTHRHFRKHG